MLLAEFFFAVAGLRSLFPCWLSARDLSQQVETTLIPWHVAPPSLCLEIVGQILLTSSPLYKPEKTQCF